MHVQSVYLIMISIDVAAFMLILTLTPTLTCIDAVTGTPVVLISALLGIITVVIVVMATVVVAFVVWKRKSGRCAFLFCW